MELAENRDHPTFNNIMAANSNYTPLEATLEDAFESQKFCDLTITCCDGKISAHRSVLSSASAFLKNLLQDNINSTEIIFPDISLHTMKLTLQLLYTGILPCNSDETWETIFPTLILLGIQINDHFGISRFEKVLSTSSLSLHNNNIICANASNNYTKIIFDPNSDQSSPSETSLLIDQPQPVNDEIGIEYSNTPEMPLEYSSTETELASPVPLQSSSTHAASSSPVRKIKKSPAKKRKRSKTKISNENIINTNIFEQSTCPGLNEQLCPEPLSLMVDRYSKSTVVIGEHSFDSGNEVEMYTTLEEPEPTSDSQLEVITDPDNSEDTEVSREDFIEAVKQATDKDHPYTSCFAKGSKLRQKKTNDLYLARSRYDHSYCQ